MGFELLKRILRHTIATAPIAQDSKLRVFFLHGKIRFEACGGRKPHMFAVSLREGRSRWTFHLRGQAALRRIIRLQTKQIDNSESFVRAIQARSRGF